MLESLEDRRKIRGVFIEVLTHPAVVH